MENDGPEQHTHGVDNIHRIVERSEPQAQAVHVNTYRGRATNQRGATCLYLLFLRVTRRSGWIGGMPTPSHDRWMDDNGYGHIQLYRRRIFCKFKNQKWTV